MEHRSVLLTITALLLTCLCMKVAAYTVPNADCNAPSDAATIQKLKTKLFCKYDVYERPIRNRTANVSVATSLDLKRIIVEEFGNKNEILGWVLVAWHDEYLKWNVTDYDGIRQFVVSGKNIWTPDLAIYNSEVQQSNLFAETNCEVNNFGRVLCVASMRSPIFCEQQLQNWPKDTRTCQLYLGSWSYDGNEIDLELYYDGYTLFDYKKNYEWELSSISVKKHITIYPCCPLEPYVTMVYDIKMSRHAALYTATVVTPAFVLGGVTLMSFWMRGVTCRTIVCIASLLGNAMFLLFVGRSLPANGDTSPFIVSYYRDAMVLSAMSLLMALCVWCLETCSAPHWLEGVTIWIRGRGGKPGQLLLGEAYESQTDISIEKNTPSKCNAAVTFLDRVSFLVFLIVYSILLAALLP